MIPMAELQEGWANSKSVDNMRMSSPGGSSIEPSVSSSYGINMITLIGCPGRGQNRDSTVGNWARCW